MKNTHVCPKCNGTDIIKIEGDVRGYGAGNNIQTGISIFPPFWCTDTCAAAAGTVKSG